MLQALKACWLGALLAATVALLAAPGDLGGAVCCGQPPASGAAAVLGCGSYGKPARHGLPGPSSCAHHHSA